MSGRSSLPLSEVRSVEEVNEEDEQSDVDDEGWIQEGVRGVAAMSCRLQHERVDRQRKSGNHLER